MSNPNLNSQLKWDNSESQQRLIHLNKTLNDLSVKLTEIRVQQVAITTELQQKEQLINSAYIPK